MGIQRFSYLFLSLCLSAAAPLPAVPNTPKAAIDTKGMPAKVLFLVRRGQAAEAIDAYHTYAEALGHPDYDLLQQIGLSLLDYGAASSDPETQVMAIFGAGVATNDRATHILTQGLSSQNPQIRLASLGLVAQQRTDTTDELVKRAINSPDALIRFEAISLLAQMKHPAAVGQAEALMIKLPPAVWFLFADIFATIGDARATRQLRRLMNHSDSTARIAAIIAAADHGRDDLLPQIRQLATHSDPSQQEACALALGVLGDQGSLDKLKQLADSRHTQVRLAASLSLYLLGKHEYADRIKKMAADGNVLAIFTLGKVKGSEELLARLAASDNIQIQTNATLALLALRDKRCLPGLQRILFSDHRGIAYAKIASHGKILTAWKAVPKANLEEVMGGLALSSRMREEALAAALELPENDFLALADSVLDRQESDLVPITITALENLDNDDAIAILKKHQQKLGAPLVRNYCNLALVRLGIEGPYKDALQHWVYDQCHVDMIRFKPLEASEIPISGNTYELTPEETSKLLISAVECLASRQDDHGVETLLHIIRDGNPKNRYAIAGLLIRTIQ